ncbi:MAG: sulfite exporter TauE/SafE family protein [Verrucomicrobiales bacterium]|jgi:uncharacterized membrane protein YfcA|nr:sulfite exporter TauE/SafE family protein [Verrucomicrobiales bacterium]
MLPKLTTLQWLLILSGVFCVGVSKGGLPGVSMIPILVFAEIFPARQSTGMLLLPLIVGDFAAIAVFHQHADWRHLRRVALPAVAGVLLGWFCLGKLSDHGLRVILSAVILTLSVLQLCRGKFGAWMERAYHSRPFAWSLGGLGGWTTMVANAAGPVMSLFFLAMRLPKMVFVGTTAWFFCLINLVKVPFSVQLGLMSPPSLWLALTVSPVIISGVFAGRWLIQRMPQRAFELVVLAFAILGALRLLF